MKIKIAPRPLPLPLKPAPRPLRGVVVPTNPPDEPGDFDERHEPVVWLGTDTRRWYEAIGRLANISPEAAYRIHYPGKHGEAGPVSRARYEKARLAGRIGAETILREIRGKSI